MGVGAKSVAICNTSMDLFFFNSGYCSKRLQLFKLCAVDFFQMLLMISLYSFVTQNIIYKFKRSSMFQFDLSFIAFHDFGKTGFHFHSGKSERSLMKLN